VYLAQQDSYFWYVSESGVVGDSRSADFGPGSAVSQQAEDQLLAWWRCHPAGTLTNGVCRISFLISGGVVGAQGI